MEDQTWRCRIRLLGGLRVERPDRRVVTRFQTQKTGALLAYLAFYLRRSHAREQLAELLWPEVEPRAGRNRLKQALASLRRQIEPSGAADASAAGTATAGRLLVADGHLSVHLDPDVVTTDVADFEAALAAAARAPDAAARRALLERAAQVYGGDLLPGYYEDWIATERERLAEAHRIALRDLADLQEREGQLVPAIDTAYRVLAADPSRPESCERLMRLLDRIGDPEAALRQYRELERRLREEVDDAPTPALRAFAARLAAGPSRGPETPPPRHPKPGSLMGEADPAPATATMTAAPAPSLPPSFTRFFGREAELTRLSEMLDDPGVRLVTLTGPGGSGKTRLALEAAARETRQTPGGASGRGAVWFVPLADVTEPALAWGAIADALRIRTPGQTPLPDQVAAALAALPPGARPLLLLDNFEQLAENEHGPAVVRDLLAGSPALTCLVTSRQALGIVGEREVPVLPLPTPTLFSAVGAPPAPAAPEASPAEPALADLLRLASVRLFLDRAQAVRPDFQLTKRNAAAVAGICDLLEGLPLAIELAAAWAQTLTPGQMLERLRRRRFDLLVSRRKDLPPRHQSLWAAIAGSYVLLPPPLRHFFARLSVFRGGWSIEAAGALWAAAGDGEGTAPEDAALQASARLQERSLIVAEPLDESTGEQMRFRMLESLREFAEEQLNQLEGGAEAARETHAAFFVGLAERAEPEIRGPDQAAWLDRLDAEHDNLRAALTYALEGGDVRAALRLGAALWRFWQMHGHIDEGRAWLARALDDPAGRAFPRERARALNGAGYLARNQDDYTLAQRLHEESLAISRAGGEVRGVATSLHDLALVAIARGKHGEAEVLLGGSLDLWRAIGDAQGIADVLNNRGLIARDQGDHDGARTLYQESLALQRRRGNRSGIAIALNNLGEVARDQGDYDAARRFNEESLAIKRSLGNRRGIAMSLLNLGMVALLADDPDTAEPRLRESLVRYRALGDRSGLAYGLEGCALLAVARRQPVRAAHLFAAAEALRERIGAPLPASERAEHDRAVAAAREALSPDMFRRAWAAGSFLTPEEAVEAVLSGDP